jgi:diguanylate cyclase (GGDEF)-like protein/PAS domain S-box-containing protein
MAGRTAYLPLSGTEIEQLLGGLVDQLVTGLRKPQVDGRAAVQAGSDVGAAMVEHHLIGVRSVVRSIELLGSGLPRLVELRDVEGLAPGVLQMLAALAGGYAEALRRRTFEEQEEIKKALFKAKRDAERGLRVSESRFREIFTASAVGIAISDLDGVIVDANPAFADIVGRTPDELPGLPLMQVLHAEHDEGLDEAYREVPHFLRRRRFTDSSGEVAWTHIAGSLLRDPDGVPTDHITIIEDLTELHLLRQELFDQTLHDVLTGLPNEQYFMSHLEEVLERADPSAQITVGRVNLDNFAVINDGIGRSAGERLLRSIATRLQTLVGHERAMVARMGTDDFAILIEDGPNTSEAGVLAASINDELAEPVYLDERGLAVSAGVGLVRRSAAGISPGELVRAADATLHRVKRSGRGQWGLYDAQADAEERDRYRLAAQMPGSWENGEISLEYQPLHDLQTGQIVALQALLRWDRAEGTVIPHPECLALAEQTGLVHSLGQWMLQEACAELAKWTVALDTQSLCLRVDLTPWLSQDPDLVGVVRTVLSDTGVESSCIRVGVPMVTLSRNRGDVMDNVQVLADLGTGVVLLGAAAGPGYLAFVEDLPVTAVEVAPDMVRRIAQRPGDDSLVSSAIRQIIPLTHSVGTKVIACEVDTPEQADWWRDAGADVARGAHFGPPVPPEELSLLLAGR